MFLVGMLGVAWLFHTLWQGGAGDKVIIRSGGKIVAENVPDSGFV